MVYRKIAQQTPRIVEISDEEKTAAKNSLKLFNSFLQHLNSALESDQSLIDVLKKANASEDQMYDIRGLLIQFQGEVRERYSNIIPEFGNALKQLKPLLSDTEISNIKDSLVDSMQRLSDVIEEYMESFDSFSSDQVQKIIDNFAKASQLVISIRSLIDHQLRNHFNKNILKKSIKDIKFGIIRRARLIRILGGINVY